MRRLTLLVGFLAGTVHAAFADDRALRLFDIGAYAVFVANWTPATKPFCAILRSEADWGAVLHPAAVMGSQRPFTPPAGFWTNNAVLVVARTAFASTGAPAPIVEGLREAANVLEIDTRFSAPPPSSFMVKQATALQLAKPLPPTIVVRDHGAVVCTLKPATGPWRAVGR